MNEERNERYAEELASLIRCETVSETGVENEEKFSRFHALLADTFPLIHSACTLEKFGCSLLYRWRGKEEKDPVCLMCHHDVVEAGGEWTYPPFSGTVAEGKVWGRGTLDTKGGLWAMLRAVEELIGEGFVPAHDVYVESACTEETGGEGADAITKELQRRGIRFRLVLDEGGMMTHDPLGGCDADFAMIGIGEKNCTDLKFTARSAGGHASTPPKDSPLVRLGKFMAEADRAKCFDARVTEPVVEMLQAFAPYSGGAMRFLFQNAGRLRGILAAVLQRVSPTAAALVRTTLAFTKAGGSDGLNVLPQEAYVTGNMRCSHHQGQQNSLARVEAMAKKYGVETTVLDPGYVSGLTSTKTPGYALVAKAVREIFPGVVPAPYIMTGASDCRYFDRVSDCCIRFLPFMIDDAQMKSIHGIDENLDVSALAPAVDFYKYVIREQ